MTNIYAKGELYTMKIELSVLFKKIQKDDKKEILEFHVQGDELPNAQELIEFAGSIVVLALKDCEAGEMNVEFKTLQRDSKKTALKFVVKGDSDEKVIKLYPFAGRNVTLILQPSQMTIDEFYNENHEGIKYNVNKDGTVDVPDGQMSIDDVENEATSEKAVDEDKLPF